MPPPTSAAITLLSAGIHHLTSGVNHTEPSKISARIDKTPQTAMKIENWSGIILLSLSAIMTSIRVGITRRITARCMGLKVSIYASLQKISVMQ